MGSWGLVDSRGVACREGGTGHAPGGRARNHCAPFLAIFHLYTSENLVHPCAISLFLLTPPLLHELGTSCLCTDRRKHRLTPLHRSRTPQLFAVLLQHSSLSLSLSPLVAINSPTFDFLKFKRTTTKLRHELSITSSLCIYNKI